MKKYGYVIKRTDDGQALVADYERLTKMGCQQVVISDKKLSTWREIKEAFPEIRQGDQLVFTSISSLGKTLKELLHFLTLTREEGLSLYFYTEEIVAETAETKTLEEMLDFVLTLQREILQEKKSTQIGFMDGKNEAGRPKILQNQIDSIIFNYENKKMSYREISHVTKLSIGTVHKYINEHKADRTVDED